jgi:hypothetical protein
MLLIGYRGRHRAKATKRDRPTTAFPSDGFNPKRGRDYVVIAPVVLPVMVWFSAVAGAPVSLLGAIAFVLIFAVSTGVLGMFTDNAGF